jgi:hypothetical protein
MAPADAAAAFCARILRALLAVTRDLDLENGNIILFVIEKKNPFKDKIRYKTKINTMITPLEDLEIQSLVFGLPKKSGDHYAISVSIGEEKERIMIQTPKLNLSNDLNLDAMTFVDMACSNPEFIESVKQVDHAMASVIKANRGTWFPNKNIDDTFVEVGQMPSVLMQNVLRLRVRKNVDIFDSAKNQLSDITSVEAGTSVRCILHVSGLWFTATRWGISWNVVQLKMYPKDKPKAVYTGYLFPDEDEDAPVSDEAEDIDTVVPPPGV